MEKTKFYKNLKFIFMFFVILLFLSTNINFVSAEKARLNRFKDSEIKLIMTNINRYIPLIKKYSNKFEVPENLLKSLMGIGKTAGILDPNDVYDQNGAIGLMQLVPFDSKGKNYHYFDCIESGCMNDEVEDLDIQHRLENQETVKHEYSNPHSSVCCAAYILSKGSFAVPITYPESGSDCEDKRSQVTYEGWESAVRRFNKFYCGGDNDIYFVERVMQLNSSFAKFSQDDIVNYGLLKFVPSFTIKAPKFPKVYSNLTKIISDLQKANIEAVVNLKFNNLGSKYNVTFTQFCEEPEVNLFNYMYDNFVNAVEFGYPRCKYPVAKEFPFSADMKDQTLSFIHNSSTNILTIKNNLSIELFKEYELSVPDNFYIGFDEINIIQNQASYLLEYEINEFLAPTSPALIGIEKIYFVTNYTAGVSAFIFYKNVSGVDKYYDTLGVEINLTVNPLPNCNSSLSNYRLKYFTCLDTKEKEEIYDWELGKWLESDETIKIKLAFALKRQ